MAKKFFVALFCIIIVAIAVVVGWNAYQNQPLIILKDVEQQILATNGSEFESYADWVWESDRTFVFDVCFLNLFVAGSAKLHIAGMTDFQNQDVVVLEATAEPEEVFKKIYNGKMVLNAGIGKDSKESLWYREVTITPEKEKTKEILFDPAKNLATREGKQYQIPSGTLDPLSVFFALLSKEFTVGKEVVLNLLSKEEIYVFKVTPKAKTDNIYILSGEVFRQDKSSSHGARFSMYIYNDKVRVPLLIKVSTGAGPIYLRLRTVQ